ncbi:MAG: response regulator, partial [bacterium]
MSKIFIVDDEPNIVRVLVLALQQAGYETRSAGSAEEALATFSGGGVPDLLITDIRLGSGMNGLELLHLVSARWPAIPVIVITAYGTIELAVEAMREGAFDFVRKPFDLDQLRKVVGNALASRRPVGGASQG